MKIKEKFGKAKVRQTWKRRLTGVLAGIIVFTTTYALVLPAVTLDESMADGEPGLVLETPMTETEQTEAEQAVESAAEEVEDETAEEAAEPVAEDPAAENEELVAEVTEPVAEEPAKEDVEAFAVVKEADPAVPETVEIAEETPAESEPAEEDPGEAEPIDAEAAETEPTNAETVAAESEEEAVAPVEGETEENAEQAESLDVVVPEDDSEETATPAENAKETVPAENVEETLPAENEKENTEEAAAPAESTVEDSSVPEAESTEESAVPEESKDEESKDEESDEESSAEESAAEENSIEESSKNEESPAEENSVIEESKPEESADVEDAAAWDAMIDALVLNGDWAEDLLTVAQSQSGYKASQTNFIVDENGVQKAYTRYGAWHGEPYEDWNSLFVLFCLNYAGVSATVMPQNADIAAWAEALAEAELYAEATDEFIPVPGDLVFFSEDGTTANRVGIVEEVALDTNYITVIEGDAVDGVKYGAYKLSAAGILGYGLLPENPDYLPAQDFEAQADDVKVVVNAAEGAFPAGTTMTAELVEDEEILTAAAAAVEEATKGEVRSAKAVDIVFYNRRGEEIEPQAAVRVSMSSAVVKEAEAIEVVHVDNEGTAEVVAQAEDVETAEDEVVFDADGFSVYVIVGTETIETTYLTADGETYKITVNYTKEAEIPEGSELVVREILRGTLEYDEYRAQTQEALGTSDVPVVPMKGDEGVADVEDIVSDGEESSADLVTYQVAGTAQSELTFIRLFDISIMHGEKEIEPKVPVEVVITYVEPVKTGDGSKLDVVHFTDDGVEVIDEVSVSEDGTEIKFEADSFSKYGTAQSAVGAGDYIIYRDNTGPGSTDYALNYNNATLGRQSVTINNGQVYSANDNVVWTFTAVTGGYRLSYQVGNTTYYLRATGNNSLGTTTQQNQASTWSYNNSHLTTSYNGSTRALRYENNAFGLGGNNGNARNIYLAKIVEPATITIHYVNEAGEEILASHALEDSTSSGSIKDLVPAVAGYTYHNTFLTSTSGTQIVPELRGAGGGTWEYQVYGQQNYTQFSSNTDIYVVFGSAYGGGSGSGGGGGDDLEIDTPSAGKLVRPNTDGTFTLSLSITGEKDTGDDPRGANVILVLDTSNSMNNGVSTGGTRFSNAVSAAQNVSSNLLGLNTDEYPNLVEMCLVEFNYDVATSGWYNKAGTANAQGTYPTGSFNRLIADASRNSGTNWEEALQAAIAAANGHNDGDNTYIIFLTDGNPSANSANTSTNRYDTEASASNYRTNKNYMTATDEARQIIQNGWNFYTIGMYGNVDVLRYLTNFAYYGESVNETENKDTEETYYYPAAQTSTLISALNDIADVISNSLAVAGVDFNDGIATDVTHTSLSSNIGTGTLGGITYRKSGGDTASYTVTTDASGNATFNIGGNSVPGTVTTISYKKIVDVEGGDPVEEDATAQVYAATYNGTTYYMPIATLSANGDFEWDVAPLGTLEDNATYTVSFVVWPDQDAYDYVTNLNNGINGYTWDYNSEVEVLNPSGSVAYYTDGVSQYPNIVRYPTTPATFAAMSNTYQTVDYYVARTEEVDGVTTTTYVKGDPIALDIPDPMVLTGSNFTVTKQWDDSLDQSQLAKLIENAEAQGDTYSITLNLKEDGVFYKSYTFTPVKTYYTDENMDTETEEVTDYYKYSWPSQTINIAPALLTSTNPGGTYKTVTIDGTTYYVLNEGHQYVLEETDLDSHFEFVTETYHPALVNGVLKNVAFELNDSDEIIDGSEAEVVGTVPLTTFVGINTLKGGINIYKRVVDDEGALVDNDSTFKVQVTLDHIAHAGEEIWFDTYEVDPATGAIVTPTEEQLTHWINTTTGEITETEPSGYKDKVQVIDAEKGIYKNANGVLYGVNGKTPVYDDETNYIGTGGYGNVSGYTNILDIQDNWMIRIVNVLAGTTYEVVETQTNGMQPSYEYWHDNASSNEKIVIGNAASNIRVINTIKNQKVKIFKTGSDLDGVGLGGATFSLVQTSEGTFEDATNLVSISEGTNKGYVPTTSGGSAITFELPFGTYTLTEDGEPTYYDGIDPVTITVNSTGVTINEVTGASISGPDDESIYTITVVDTRKTATVKVTKNVTGLTGDQSKEFDFTINGVTAQAVTTKLVGNTTADNHSVTYTEIPYGTSITVTETQDLAFDTTYSVNDAEAASGTTATFIVDDTTVNSDGIAEVVFTNTRSKQLVKVFKYETGSNPEKALQGAQFSLTGPDGTDISYTGLTTNADGYLVYNNSTFLELPVNSSSYILTETKAPDGYNLMAENVVFTVTAGEVIGSGSGYTVESGTDTVDGITVTVYTIKVQNSAGTELPHTGGSGTFLYTLSGLALIGASALMYGFRLRRRRKEVKSSL